MRQSQRGKRAHHQIGLQAEPLKGLHLRGFPPAYLRSNRECSASTPIPSKKSVYALFGRRCRMYSRKRYSPAIAVPRSPSLASRGWDPDQGCSGLHDYLWRPSTGSSVVRLKPQLALTGQRVLMVLGIQLYIWFSPYHSNVGGQQCINIAGSLPPIRTLLPPAGAGSRSPFDRDIPRLGRCVSTRSKQSRINIKKGLRRNEVPVIYKKNPGNQVWNSETSWAGQGEVNRCQS